MNKRILKLNIVFAGLLLAGTAFAQPPEPPPGKVWILNHEMSDEFDADSPGRIWKVFDKGDSWDRTAAWDVRAHEPVRIIENGKENYWLAMNPMWYEPEDVFTKNGRTYYFAGGGMDTHEMQTYGYFEVRIRPSDFPFGSGVFMHSRAFSDGPCGQNYKTELDIIENMGYTGPGAGNWNNFQHVNHHVKPTDANCAIGESLNAGGSTPLNAPLGFNVVAAHWKNKDSVDFYLDGQYWKTIEFIEDFYLAMPMILTMETYSWGSDENNATNPKPQKWMWADTFRTKEQRAVYYDWVRTWYLEDIDTAVYNVSRDTIGFHTKPLEVIREDKLRIRLLHSATDNRDVIVSLHDSLSNWLAGDTLKVSRGVRSLNAVLDIADVNENAFYFVKCNIREEGSDENGILGYDSTSIQFKAVPRITLVKSDSMLRVVAPGSQYTLDVIYEAADSMKIAVECRTPSGAWIGGNTVNVPDGDGIASIPINLTQPTLPGTGYYWKTYIMPRSGDWRDALYALQFIPFQVIEKLVDATSITGIAEPVLVTDTGMNVSVDYSTTIDADLRLKLYCPCKTLGLLDTALLTGKGSLELFLKYSDPPQPWMDVTLVSCLYASGTDSLLAADTLTSIPVMDVADTVRILNAPISLPTDTAWFEISIGYYAIEEGVVNGALFNNGGEVIAEAETGVSRGSGSVDLFIVPGDPVAGDSNYYVARLSPVGDPATILAADTLTGISIFVKNTGVENLMTGGGLQVYPNPAIEELLLKLPLTAGRIESISLTDQAGKAVWFSGKTFKPDGRGVISLNLSGIENGMYILNLKTSTRNFTSVIVKK